MLANTATRLSIQPEEAAKERVSRELARRSLSQFGQYSLSWWNPLPVHELVCSYLEQVETFIRTEGKSGIGRLMVMMPPRHGKTWTASRLFPAWFLGRNPNCEVILTSYGADLAQDNSRAVRSIVTGNKYAAVFGEKSVVDEPVTLSEDSRSKANWDLAAPNRGGVVAAGVGGGITGKGAHLLVIDDPFKNREEAESESRRSLVMDWYRSSAYTRLEKGGAIVIMHTRWHREDLIGQLLREQILDPMADQWKVVCLPALAHEPGEYASGAEDQRQAMSFGVYLDTADPLDRPAGQALCAEMFSDLQLQKTRAVIGEYDFAALYQQQPRPMEGGFFDERDFTVVERGEVPEGLKWYRYVDLSLGEKSTSDWNASIATAFDEKTGEIYYRDLLHVHELNDFSNQLEALMLTPEERETTFGFEDVAFQSLVLQEFMRRPQLVRIDMRDIRPQGDKVTRARAVQSRAKQGKIKLIRGPWIAEFMREASDFPKGKHDDMVDAASGGLQMVEEFAMNTELVLWGA
jgi:predicted phage terminase large subunit-like protein